MYNLFLNDEDDVFYYSEGVLQELNPKCYIGRDDVAIPKNIVANIITVMELPADYEDGKYKYVNHAFVLNPLPEGEPNDGLNETV